MATTRRRFKLPTPPLPNALQPPPPKPGEKTQTPVESAAEAGIHVIDWLDERTSVSAAGRWMMFRKVPKGVNWFYTLGSAAMFSFLSQAVTGVFLAMYYDPSPTRAYESARFITNEAFLGEFVRGMHKWGSSVMVYAASPAGMSMLWRPSRSITGVRAGASSVKYSPTDGCTCSGFPLGCM